jgi:hypothetical protein
MPEGVARRLFSQQAGVRYVLKDEDVNEEVDAEVGKAMDGLTLFQSKAGTFSSAIVKMSAKSSKGHLWCWAKHGNPAPRLKRLGGNTLLRRLHHRVLQGLTERK